jgi:tRNA threonylcarbamoyladenosine biosynthesis protein TsaB
MAKILCIDASAVGCSVAIVSQEGVLAFVENPEEKSAATYLTTYIEQVCKKANLVFAEIDAVAVAKGPGSYTGLRVAVSTAKGLAMAINKPLISYDTLDAVALQAKTAKVDFIIPMLDARRTEVYCKVFKASALELVSETEALLVEANSFSEFLKKGKCFFLGNGSQKCQEILTDSNVVFSQENIGTQCWHAQKLIIEKFENKDFEDLVTFEPFYLKEYLFKTKKV